MGEVGLYGLYVCNLPARMQTKKTRPASWLGVISLFPTASMAFQGPDKFHCCNEGAECMKYVWMSLSRKWSQFDKSIIHSHEH